MLLSLSLSLLVMKMDSVWYKFEITRMSMARNKNRKYYNLEIDILLLISKMLNFLLINIGNFFIFVDEYL
jgi:hypothetical protein